MSNIYELLEQISYANYGRDVRDAIRNAIELCYTDATGNSESITAAVNSLTGLYSEVNGIGTVINGENNEDSVSVNTENYTVVSSITLTPGTWIIFYGGQWGAGEEGYRWMAVNDTESERPIGTRYTIQLDGNSSYGPSETKLMVERITEEKTYYLWGYQNSGSYINCWPILVAINIKRDVESEEELETLSIRDIIALQEQEISLLNNASLELDDERRLQISGLSSNTPEVNDRIEIVEQGLGSEITTRSSLTSSLTNQIAVERSRIDGLIALPDGSTTADAELIDIRVGDDNVTYNSAGDAVRLQLRDVKQEINDFGEMLPSTINILDERKCESGYLNSSGVVTQYSDWITVPMIDVSGHSAVCFTAYNNSTNTRTGSTMYFLCTYDSSGNFIEQISNYSKSYYNVTSGVKYIRFSYHGDAFADPMVEYGNASTSEYVAYDWASYLHNSPYATPSDIYTTYFNQVYGINRNSGNDTEGYIKENGDISVFQDWATTDFCYVADLSNIVASFSAIGSTSRANCAMYFVSTYDANKNFIEQLDATVSPPYTISIDEEVSYIRFCYHADSYWNVMVQNGTVRSSEFIEYEEPQTKLKREYYDGGNDWTDIKWVAVGDSLTEVNARTTLHYHDYIAEATGITVVNMGRSGTGYKRTEEQNYAFYQRILDVPSDADVVTIFGSGNDCNWSAMGFDNFAEALGNVTDTTTDTICGCINKAIDNLYSILPTVQFGIVTPNPWISYNPANVGNDMDLYSQTLVEICKRRGIPCLDLYHCSGMRPWEESYRTLCYSNDEGNGVHPNELGHKILAPHFKAFLDTLLI